MKEICSCRKRSSERDNEELKSLQNRLKRLIGQLNGVSKMLDENRYCGDILIQVAAIESALQEVGYSILKTHMKTCVKDEILEGKENAMDEAFTLIKHLK